MRPPWIVCAAVKFENITLTGPRHYDPTMHRQLDSASQTIQDLHKYCRRNGTIEQGFIDQFGVFHGRVEAMEIVKQNGQPFDIERNGGSDKELYSEGIY